MLIYKTFLIQWFKIEKLFRENQIKNFKPSNIFIKVFMTYKNLNEYTMTYCDFLVPALNHKGSLKIKETKNAREKL